MEWWNERGANQGQAKCMGGGLLYRSRSPLVYRWLPQPCHGGSTEMLLRFDSKGPAVIQTESHFPTNLIPAALRLASAPVFRSSGTRLPQISDFGLEIMDRIEYGERVE